MVDVSEREERISKAIVDAAFRIHKELGPGLLESVYERCLKHELRIRGLEFISQVPLAIEYEGITIDGAYRLDLVVEGCVVVELKAVENFQQVHFAQLLTYLKLSRLHLGLLINFNVPVIKEGIRRAVR